MNLTKLKKAVTVDDDHIINGSPYVVEKYGKKFTIQQVKWMQWSKYSYHMAMFLGYYQAACTVEDLPDNLNDLELFRNNIRLAFMNKNTVKKVTYHFFKMAKLQKNDIKFIKKNFTIDDIAEFFCYYYLFNIKSVKLNCKIALNLISQQV